MKTLSFIFAPLFAAWFWQRTPNVRTERTWPEAIPRLAADSLDASYTRDGGKVSFVCYTVRAPGADAMEAVCRSYASDGWAEQPIRTHELVIFTRGNAVASALVQDIQEGARVAVIQRNR